MRRIIESKVRKSGKNVFLTIPKEVVRNMNLKDGEKVEIYLLSKKEKTNTFLF